MNIFRIITHHPYVKKSSHLRPLILARSHAHNALLELFNQRDLYTLLMR